MFPFKITLKKKLLIACLLANAMDFYNFTLCGVFITVLSKLYFPSDSEFSSLLGGIFAFSAAFLTRPIGALVFGYIGDKYGRKKALTFSIFLAGVPTLIISCLPTYASLGIIAPCILLFCRMLQGICTGGGYNGIGIFILEHMRIRRGLISGLLSASCVVGALFTTISAVIVNRYQGFEHGWRIPYFLGASIIFISLYIKKTAKETDDFATKNSIKSLPIVAVIKNHSKQYFLAIATGALNGLLCYTLFGFLNIYLSQYVGVKLVSSLFYSFFGLISFLIACLVSGHMYDLSTSRHPMRYASFVAMSTSTVAFYFLQNGDLYSIIIGQVLLGIGVGTFVGPCHAFLQHQFSPEVRFTGVASGFSIGMAISGSTNILFMTYILQEFNFKMAPAVGIFIAACLWLLAYKKTNLKRKRLPTAVPGN